ncbi:MAG: hypothetical protein RLZZ424_1253 [Bacteroidota bacterium]
MLKCSNIDLRNKFCSSSVAFPYLDDYITVQYKNLITMKKFFLACLVVSTIIACSPKTETASTFAAPADLTSYNLDSSANIDLVKKMITAFEAGDSVTYRSCYADSAKFHDNGNDMTLDQNVGNFGMFKGNGLTFKVVQVDPIWEIVNKEADKKGVTNYVMSFQTMVFKKGEKEVKLIMSVVNGMKDGKIVEEWGLYDTKPLMDLIAQK